MATPGLNAMRGRGWELCHLMADGDVLFSHVANLCPWENRAVCRQQSPEMGGDGGNPCYPRVMEFKYFLEAH